uniref:Uncharacterized protein n=1 Tax=viral metagenome TaxID=1070528 RepID=A0A6C0HHP8_9ZZZZ
MDADKYEQSSEQPRYDNYAMVNAKIDELIRTINIIRDYENPFQYITFLDSDTSKQITAEITPGILTLPNEVIQNQMRNMGNKSNIVQAINTKYSVFDHGQKYKLTQDIPIETKINLLYAESLKYSRDYCEYALPSKYAQIFRENGYRNIYEKVKSDLLKELNILLSRKIELLSNRV